jgi:hypothetical protein
VVALVSDPDPIIVRHSGNPNYPWLAAWTAVFTESAGLGGNVDFINIGLRNLAGLETPSLRNFGASEIVAKAGTNHLDARGTLRVPLTEIYYSGNPGGSRTITIIMTAQIHDDRGNLITATSEVKALFDR